jgi:hypothetical protein
VLGILNGSSGATNSHPPSTLSLSLTAPTMGAGRSTLIRGPRRLRGPRRHLTGPAVSGNTLVTLICARRRVDRAALRLIGAASLEPGSPLVCRTCSGLDISSRIFMSGGRVFAAVYAAARVVRGETLLAILPRW